MKDCFNDKTKWSRLFIILAFIKTPFARIALDDTQSIIPKIYRVRFAVIFLIRRCHEDFKSAFSLKRFKSILPNSSNVKFDPANSNK